MSLRRFLSAFSVLTSVALIAGFAARPAMAEEVDQSEEPSFFAKTLGAVGLLHIPGKGIDYQERAPLVVPPITNYIQPSTAPNPAARTQQDPWNFNAPVQTQEPVANERAPQLAVTLPAPVEANTVRQRNPDFPVDPEVRAAQKNKNKKKKGPTILAEDPFYGGRVLRNDELNSTGRTLQSPEVVHQDNRDNQNTLNVPLIGDLWRTRGQQPAPAPFAGEPERQSLTQPPTGYLTPSKNAPYGVVSADPRAQPQPQPHANFPQPEGSETPRPR